MLFPFQKEEMMVLPFSREDLFICLNAEFEKEGQAKLTGTAHLDHFDVSASQKKGDSFSVRMVGRIENTSTGGIAFIRYSYFKSTLIYIYLWTLVCVLVSLLFFSQQNVFSAMIAIGIGFLNYIFSYLNFFRKKKVVQQVFTTLLSTM